MTDRFVRQCSALLAGMIRERRAICGVDKQDGERAPVIVARATICHLGFMTARQLGGRQTLAREKIGAVGGWDGSRGGAAALLSSDAEGCQDQSRCVNLL
jgi:hypothetical protein